MAVFDGVVLIAEDDQVVYHCAYGRADYRFDTPLGPDARFRIASLSKQFTDAAIGLLAQDGRVALDAPLADYLPAFPEADRITLQHLIDHTSGVPHTNNLAWMDMNQALSLDAIVAGLADEPLAFEPGSDRAYSNGGYVLLAAVIEAVTGQSFEQYIDDTFARNGYTSVGHEPAFAVVPGMAYRYAPGPVYGARVEAPVYVTANRIGGGSLFASAEDVWRFFRDTYTGRLLDSTLTAALFSQPSDGDVLITGRSPGALAQVYLDFTDGLAVVTLSSNAGWPGSFNQDLVALYRGEEADLTPFVLASSPLSAPAADAYAGSFVAERFGWDIVIERTEDDFVFVQDDVRTAFARTESGAFHLPIYDWLCDYDADKMGFTCRQRDPDAEIRFVFRRAD